jgi:hypothetical protein
MADAGTVHAASLRQQPEPRGFTSGVDLRRCLIGFAGGLLGGLAMNVFSRAVASLGNTREAKGAAPGLDRVGRGAQPPQADGVAEDDATVRVGTVAYRALTGRTPRRTIQSWLGTAVHYAFSGTVGAFYAMVAGHLPFIRAGHGILYGTTVWIVADETIIPLLGLSRGPRQLPVAVHAYALASHWVYGLTLESAVHSASRDSRRPLAGIQEKRIPHGVERT